MKKLRPAALVAVVDDDIAVLESVSDLMASAGYAAITFDSARQLLQSGRLRDVGCLISDIRMPDIDGWELAHRARASMPGLPLVFMTAHDPVECDAAAQLPRLAGSQLLLKPFNPDDLLEAVREALNPPDNASQ